MGLRINYNTSAMRAHFSLNNADRTLARTLEQLSSGYRIRRAADDPAAMTLANNIRHHLTGITQATANVEEGISMLQAAEGGMQPINDQLLRLRQLALGALNDGALDQSQRNAFEQELDAAVSAIDQLALNTRYGTIPLLDGTLDDNTLSEPARAVYELIDHDDTLLPAGVEAGSTITVNPPTGNLNRASLSVTFAGSPTLDTPLTGLDQGGQVLGSLAGETLTIRGPRGEIAIPLTDTLTIRQLTGTINANAGSTGARAQYDSFTGALTLESLHYGAGGLSVEQTNVNAGTVGLLDTTPGEDLLGDPLPNTLIADGTTQTLNLSYTDQDGVLQTLTLTQDTSLDDGRTFTAPGWTVTLRETGDADFGSTLSAPSDVQTATRESTHFLHVGSLSDQRTRVSVPDMRAAALGHSARANASGYTDLLDLATQNVFATGSIEQITDALRVIDAAIDEVSSSRGRIGALVASGLESTLDSLRVTFESLTSSESQLRDTDFAEASARFARDNIIYQASTSMLAQANQLPQSVLQLLQ